MISGPQRRDGAEARLDEQEQDRFPIWAKNLDLVLMRISRLSAHPNYISMQIQSGRGRI